MKDLIKIENGTSLLDTATSNKIAELKDKLRLSRNKRKL